MSTGFNWFKRYEIHTLDEGKFYCERRLYYYGGGSTSHSAGNIIMVQDLLERYGGVRIPNVRCYDLCDDYVPDLIDPKVMSKACDKVLQSTDDIDSDMRDRIS